ncbi:MAG: hypothetical protein IPI50_09625 [Saprospiraceae bacterium]|nr:hypothetical protein [Saprospiraceae bacterium]
MKTKIFIITILMYFLSFSCRDSGPEDLNLPIPKDSCVVFESIFDDSSLVNLYPNWQNEWGVANCTKVNSVNYFVPRSFRRSNSNDFSLQLLSFDKDSILADAVIFVGIPLKEGCYNIVEQCSRIINFNNVCVIFDNWNYDTVIDSYRLDTNSTDNKIEIVSIDTLQKIIEGRFACSFVFANDRPKWDPKNLDTMRFFNGYFKGNYQ